MQTTGAMTGVNCPIEFSIDGTDWDNIAGSTTAIEPSEQTRMTGVAYTLDGDYAIITGGKKEPVEVEVKILYTTVSTEAYALVQAAWEANSPVYLRWSPQGGDVGDKRFKGSAGVLSAFLPPPAIADDANPVPAGFKVMFPRIVEETVSA